MEQEKIIAQLMHDNNIGLSITEIVKLTKLSRSAVRTNLARLEGAGKVKARKIGMAKVYILNLDILQNIHTIENNRENEGIIPTLIK